MVSQQLSVPTRAAWDAVLARDARAARRVLAALDDADRRALAGLLPAWSRSLKAETRDAWDAAESVQVFTDWMESTWNVACAAAVACCPSARPAAEVLRRLRRDLRHVHRLPAELMVDVAADRGVDWLPDLVERLIPGTEMGGFATDLWRDVDRVLSAGNAPAPADEIFTAGWLGVLAQDCWQLGPAAQADWLAGSRYLPDLLPRIFDIEGLSCPEGLAVLAERLPQHRTSVLDGCLHRIMNGATAPRLATFVAVWQALEVTPEEVMQRIPVYTAIVAGGAPGVATAAHQALAGLDDDGRLSVDDLLDLAQVALPRPQQHLVKAHLALLRRAASRHGERLQDIAGAVELATEHIKPAVQTLAADILREFGRRTGSDGSRLQQVAVATNAAIEQESGDQRAARAVPFADPPLPARAPAAGMPTSMSMPTSTSMPTSMSMPGRADTPERFIQDLMGVRDVTSLAAWPPPVALDALLDGLAHLTATDPTALAEQLAARLRNGFVADGLSRHPAGPLLYLLLTSVLKAHCGPAGVPRHDIDNYLTRSTSTIGALVEQAAQGECRRPGWLRAVGVPGLRMAELAHRLATESRPGLLATPTDTLGRISPGVLLDRIEAAEQSSRRPWPIDLDAALLRTTRDVPDELSRRAGRLASPAGRRLARWWSAARPTDLGGLIGLLLPSGGSDAGPPDRARGVAAGWLSALPHHHQQAVHWGVGPLPEEWPWRGCYVREPVEPDHAAAAVITWLGWPLTNLDDDSGVPEARYRLASQVVTDPLGPEALGRALGRAIDRRQVSLKRLLPVLLALAAHRPEESWPFLVAALPDVLGSGNSTAFRFVEITEDVARHLDLSAEVPALALASKGRSKLAIAARSLEATFATRRDAATAP